MPDQANNVTPRQTPAGYLSDSFDHTAIWEEQCSPLVEELWGICRDHDIPLFMAALHRLEDKGDSADSTLARVIHFPGPHRVPHQMAVVAKIYDDPAFCEFIIQMSVLYAARQFDVDGELEA